MLIPLVLIGLAVAERTRKRRAAQLEARRNAESVCGPHPEGDGWVCSPVRRKWVRAYTTPYNAGGGGGG